MHTDVQHDDWLYKQLQDAGFAAEYKRIYGLNAASERRFYTASGELTD